MISIYGACLGEELPLHLMIHERNSNRTLFGSWVEIEGHSETGYFLGHEVIKALEEKMSLPEIALLDDFEQHSREILERMKQED